MEPTPVSPPHRWISRLASRPFWAVAAMLAATTLFHYFRTYLLPSPANTFLSRHAVERIVFVLPIAIATFTFGQTGGLVTLACVVLIMLPRAIWLSSHPVDALIETAAAALVGYLVTRMIYTQVQEKALRQKAVARLRAINEITAIVTESLELEQILNGALSKVLDVMGLEIGLIFLVDQQTREFVLAAYEGISEKSAAKLGRLGADEGSWGQVTQSGELMLVQDSSQDPPAVQREGLRTKIIVPLKSKDRVQGILAASTRRVRPFLPEELELITAIGSEIGVAIENARLHQDVAQQLQIQQRLNEIAERIASELELDRILLNVLHIARELTGADGGGIGLFDQESGSIHYPYLHNLPQELANVSPLNEKVVAREVITTGRPVVIEDYQTHPGAIPALAEAGFTSVVAVPVVSGDHLFGALVLVSIHRAKLFSDRDVAILTGIGRQAGIAMENAQLYESMRFYARQINQAQEDERKRIARELHDETIQTLIVIARRLEGLARLPDQWPEAARQRLAALQELIGNTLNEMRRFVQDLRPPTLNHLGLMAAVEGLTSDLTEKDRIAAEVKVTGEAQRLMPEEELVLFRIVQEALSNVRRHSGASRATVQVEFEPCRVRMTINDNGRGFNAPERIDDLVSTCKLGLLGMQERARTLGGTLTVQSEPGQGTVVIVDVPST